MKSENSENNQEYFESNPILMEASFNKEKSNSKKFDSNEKKSDKSLYSKKFEEQKKEKSECSSNFIQSLTKQLFIPQSLSNKHYKKKTRCYSLKSQNKVKINEKLKNKNPNNFSEILYNSIFKNNTTDNPKNIIFSNEHKPKKLKNSINEKLIQKYKKTEFKRKCKEMIIKIKKEYKLRYGIIEIDNSKLKKELTNAKQLMGKYYYKQLLFEKQEEFNLFNEYIEEIEHINNNFLMNKINYENLKKEISQLYQKKMKIFINKKYIFDRNYSIILNGIIRKYRKNNIKKKDIEIKNEINEIMNPFFDLKIGNKINTINVKFFKELIEDMKINEDELEKLKNIKEKDLYSKYPIDKFENLEIDYIKKEWGFLMKCLEKIIKECDIPKILNSSKNNNINDNIEKDDKLKNNNTNDNKEKDNKKDDKINFNSSDNNNKNNNIEKDDESNKYNIPNNNNIENGLYNTQFDNNNTSNNNDINSSKNNNTNDDKEKDNTFYDAQFDNNNINSSKNNNTNSNMYNTQFDNKSTSNKNNNSINSSKNNNTNDDKEKDNTFYDAQSNVNNTSNINNNNINSS